MTPTDEPHSVDSNAFELIPRGRTEPFSTAEYDVLPRGQFDVVRHNYYSPIPDVATVPEEVWTRRSDLVGLELNSAAGIDFIETRLGPYVGELDVPLDDPRHAGRFFLRNAGFESVDAELLYAMIRFLRPARLVELGSGYSTLLAGIAARRNAGDGTPTEHVAYDPFPRSHVLGDSVPPPTRLESIAATEVPMSVFASLAPGDVLFVDTTHTVKLASDVNFIILEVLPRLRPGVVVHFHDVFLPWEYPREWFERMKYFWAEQYLLQAFLAFNTSFQVLIPAQAIAREFPERLKAVFPSFGVDVSPASMWLRRGDGESTDRTGTHEEG